MAELKILSFNTQGLGGIKKQKDVFQYLNDKNFETVQFLLLIAKYYISMCRNTNKPLMFLLYKINVRSLYLSHREIALKSNKMAEFMQSWRPFEKLLDIG